MYRKYFLTILAAASLLLLSNLAAFAQSGQLRGLVTMRQADGKETPLAGAAIDVYRVDVAGEYKTTTDKKGAFVFAGIPFTGEYIIAASAPNASAKVLTGVKAGRDVEYKLVLDPGNGKHPTKEEAAAMAGSSSGNRGGGGESAEDRKKREELEAKNREIMASNEKNKNINEVINRTFKAGNEALSAKRYDEAITQYSEGLAADPEQPALLTNRSIAYRARGVEHYNAAIQSKDDAAKNSGLEAAKKDFKDAVDSAEQAVKILKAQTVPTDPTALNNYNANKLSALSVRAEGMRLFISKSDQTQMETGAAAFQEYIAAEPDAAKKLKAQLDYAELLRVTGAWDKALAEFKKILETSPDNVDALRGAGLSLFGSPNKSDYQEAANYLQRFVDKAPDTHPEKASAKESLEYLKSQENIKPQKPAATGGRRRG
ncbi:MAG TPA: carboxypeptidase-like regulatory domain-containing protein [Pyrinomonadaceae bacterium]|jgi:tetratricopeptide (TPR) repeat protein|nr:carboxypeptidase-like regulatory domain-containing protein [Pyrinomonadaceae bacterium]